MDGMMLGAILIAVTAPVSIPLLGIVGIGWALCQVAQAAPGLLDVMSSASTFSSANTNSSAKTNTQTPQEKMQAAKEIKFEKELAQTFDQIIKSDIPKPKVAPPKPVIPEPPKIELPKPPKIKSESTLQSLYNRLVKPKKTAAILNSVEAHAPPPVIAPPPLPVEVKAEKKEQAVPVAKAATPADEMVSTMKAAPPPPEKAQVADRVGLMNHPPEKMNKALAAINEYFEKQGNSGWQKESSKGYDVQFKDNHGNNAFEVQNDKMVVQGKSSANMEALLIGFKAMYGDKQTPAINCPPELEQQWKDVAAKLKIPIEIKGPVPAAELAAMKKMDTPKVEAAVDNTNRAGLK